MPVLLIRHASAGDRHRWEGDDRLRPLDAEGRRQSEQMVGLLDGLPVSRVVSSPARRCVETVEPLAAARGLVVEEDDRLAEGAAVRAADLLRQVRGSDTALCSHGDVVPELLALVAREDGVGLGAGVTWPKGSVWVLDHDGNGRFASARLLVPSDDRT